jgi:RIO kinase 1
MSLEFLRRDCININDFFLKQGAETLTSISIFNFVTSVLSDLRDPNIQTDSQFLDKILKENLDQKNDPNYLLNDKVFENMYIPQSI